MKKLFYFGLIGLTIFEILNVYFIMPFPGSQRINSIDLAYFLYFWRWVFRIIFLITTIAGFIPALAGKKKWIPILLLIISATIIYIINGKMTAEKMFLQPQSIQFESVEENRISGERLVIGIENNGEAKAYPIVFLSYHHQIQDQIGGKQIIVTYCNVCRSGRVFEPLVNGNYEKFRLVGMDHFNAMFEDATTKSWWQQATGEAITGTLKGNFLPEFPSHQMTVNKWFELYPNGKVMQADEKFLSAYDSLARFEQGLSTGSLTRTDSLSWEEKSWVIGVKIGEKSKAYDWNYLKKNGVIHDKLGETFLVILLSSDNNSFVVFERMENEHFTLKNDTIWSNGTTYNFLGQDVNLPSNNIKIILAYQEFWHSWTTFHPNTLRYPE